MISTKQQNRKNDIHALAGMYGGCEGFGVVELDELELGLEDELELEVEEDFRVCAGIFAW